MGLAYVVDEDGDFFGGEEGGDGGVVGGGEGAGEVEGEGFDGNLRVRGADGVGEGREF